MYDHATFDFYLQLLGVTRSHPDLQLLTRLVRAHLDRLPFENVSKLLYYRRNGRKDIPDLRVYLDRSERYHFGGTCYSSNYFLNLLLNHLGFDARLCGADMNRPDVHVVNVVTVGAQEYLVDVGYAAPFLDPMPLDLKSDFKVELADDHYYLLPRDQNGRSRMEMRRDGEVMHGYLVNPIPRTIDHFVPAIVDSYRPAGTFMTSLLLTKFSPEHSVRIYNMSVRSTSGSVGVTYQMKTSSELFGAIEDHFGIPTVISAEALADIDLSGNAWS